MRWILVVLVGVSLAPPARADAAGVVSTTLFTAAELSLAIDAWQTLGIIHTRGKYEENPIMGRHPDTATVLWYFGVLAAGQAALWAWGPPWLSGTISGATLVMEVSAISHNFSLGFGLRI